MIHYQQLFAQQPGGGQRRKQEHGYTVAAVPGLSDVDLV
jgi:hypothetical protein